ncbi:MAG TPA: DUF3572 domain-containing protein [Hyphomicrobiaceae bacterium]|nr:DUF3572 domain-containing protein [Hyphomicrobiaceae bacterium]
MVKSAPPIDFECAESIALAGLTFLAEDPARLGRFLALTGIGPQELRTKASAPEMLAAVLEHLLADESLLLVFAASKNVRPEAVQPAHALLAQGTTRMGRP